MTQSFIVDREFGLFRELIFTSPGISSLGGRISNAIEGNFLEANNLALNVFDKVDRTKIPYP